MKVNFLTASGECNVLISLLFDEHAKELSCLQICLDQFRTFYDCLIFIPFMMATSEFIWFDRRGVTP